MNDGHIKLEPSWKARVGAYLQRDDMQALAAFLRERKVAGARIYPPGPQIFAALNASARLPASIAARTSGSA